MFADLSELSRNRPAGEDVGGIGHVHSAREHFHTYLQSLDVDRAGLPKTFQAKLAKALGHYGVDRAGPHPRAGRGGLPDLPCPATGGVGRRRSSSRCCASGCAKRHPVRRCASRPAWRWNDWSPLPRYGSRSSPIWPAESCSPGSASRCCAATGPACTPRSVSTCATSTPLRRRRTGPPGSPRWWAAPSHWYDCSGQRLGRDGLDHAPLLEVLTRRYYGNKGITAVRTVDGAGVTFVVAERADSWVVSAAVRFDRLGGALHGLAELASDEDTIDADVYLVWENQPEDPDAMAAALHEVIRAHPLPNQVRRLTTSVAGRAGAVMHHHFTFRPSATGMTEERLIRGLHPYIAQRMQLERLRKFDLTRLPSVGRGRLPVPVRGAGEPVRRPARRVRPGPRPDRAARPRRPAGRAADGRGHHRHLPRLDPPRPVAAAVEGTLQHQPDRRSTSGRRATSPAPSWRRSPGGCCRPPRAPGWRRSCSSPGSGTRRPAQLIKTGSAHLVRRHRRQPTLTDRRAVRRTGRAARRVPAEGAAGQQPQHGLPVRADRHARRASPNTTSTRLMRARPGGPAEGPQQRGDRRRRRHHTDGAPPRGRHQGGAARRPDQVAGRAVRTGVPPGHRRAGPRRADAGAAGVVRAVVRRPDLDGVRAPRTWTGWPPRSSGSSSSPRTAARSTSWWPASTSARSRTGTPRRRCSCTPRASW